MSNSNTASSGGIGFFGLLTIVFIVLKLTGFIAWSWWWVLSPILSGVVIAVGILAVVIIVTAITFIWELFSK